MSIIPPSLSKPSWLTNPPLRISPAKTLVLLVCWWVLSFVAGAFLVQATGGAASPQAMRWAILEQNVVMFILPAVATALLACPEPWHLLRTDRRPTARMAWLTAALVVVSIPAMNVIVDANASMHLPDSMSELENTLRRLEEAAEATVSMIVGEHTSFAGLIGAILLVGIVTGIGEEMFFRGALQPVLARCFMSRHAAIWATAFIFSAIHLQIFGFVPRLLMGAMFGYLAVWSGSIWLPAMAHALNNSIVVTVTWGVAHGYLPDSINHIGTSAAGWWSIILALASVALTAWIISYLRRLRL